MPSELFILSRPIGTLRGTATHAKDLSLPSNIYYFRHISPNLSVVEVQMLNTTAVCKCAVCAVAIDCGQNRAARVRNRKEKKKEMNSEEFYCYLCDNDVNAKCNM